MDQTQTYRPSQFQLEEARSRALHRLDERRSLAALASIWLAIAVLVFGMRHFVPSTSWWLAWPIAAFLIAGRIGALLQLVHESAHGLISLDPRRNVIVGEWLCALPVGVNYRGYVRNHLRHHAFTATDRDPPSDTEKYRVVDFWDPRLYALFAQDLLGLTALKVFFAYGGSDQAAGRGVAAGGRIARLARSLGAMAFVQLVILAALFQFDVVSYILLWVVPAASAHMFLMRIRGIAEHGLAKQLGLKVSTVDEGTRYTRSFMTPRRRYRFAPLRGLERILISSLNVNYHHEHHLFPRVPFYHLPELHRLVADRVAARNPDVYAAGYFAAAARAVAR
jgi:fatty acid desaturase